MQGLAKWPMAEWARTGAIQRADACAPWRAGPDAVPPARAFLDSLRAAPTSNKMHAK